MKPIPVDFHIGPLQVHTYGIGLALTFWFGFTYFERRLRRNGYRTDWFVPVFLWIILAAVVGARALHVLSNLSYYSHNPGDILAIWHGGLSSFGGPALRRARPASSSPAAAAPSSRSAAPSTWSPPSSWPAGPWAACSARS